MAARTRPPLLSIISDQTDPLWQDGKMRESGRCPTCFGEKIAYLECLLDQRESYLALGTMSYRPVWVEGATIAAGDPAKVTTHKGSKTTTKAGTVEVFICAECGRLESYVQDPQWVPFERLNAFAWIGAAEDDVKRSRRCPNCGGEKIGHLPSLPDTVEDETSIAPRCLALVTSRGRTRRLGIIEAYVCAACGHLEEYVADVDSLTEKIPGLSWQGSKSTPYR
jgi:hypothetical protein